MAGATWRTSPFLGPAGAKPPHSLASSPRGVQVSGRLSVQPSLTARGENCHGKLPLEPWAPSFTCLRALVELLPCGLPDGDPCCSWVSLSPRRSSCHPARAHFPGGGPSHTLCQSTGRVLQTNDAQKAQSPKLYGQRAGRGGPSVSHGAGAGMVPRPHPSPLAVRTTARFPGHPGVRRGCCRA